MEFTFVVILSLRRISSSKR